MFNSTHSDIIRSLSYESSQSNISSDINEELLDSNDNLLVDGESNENTSSKVEVFPADNVASVISNDQVELTDEEDEELLNSIDPFEDISKYVDMYKKGKDIKDIEKEYELDEIDRMFARTTKLSSKRPGFLSSLGVKSTKELIWRSGDYTAIFNRLGGSVSSGIVDYNTMAVLLPTSGFYTLFIHNSKSLYDKNIDLGVFRALFKYVCISDVKRSEINTADVTGSGHFKIKMCGEINIKPNVTYLILIYAITDDQIVDFQVVPSNFDYKPDIMYKLYYCGPYYNVPLPLNFKRRLRVLSLDNCENFGTSIISVLYLLEKRLEEINKCKINLTDYFDYVCGTGTGSIIALCLLKGYTIKELKTQWHIIITNLFKFTYTLPSGIIFDHCCIGEFKRSWIDILGTEFMTNKTNPLCMVTSTNVKTNPYGLFLFRNYNVSSLPDMIDGTCHSPMWLAGWASTALPTCVRGPNNVHLDELGYNLTNKIHLIDGSLVCSTPSLVALQELSSLYGISLTSLIHENLDLLLSIGNYKDNSNRTTSTSNTATWKILLNCKSLIYNTQLQHEHSKKLFEENKDKYHRIQVPTYQGYKYNKEHVDHVLNSTNEYITTNKYHQIEQIANILN